MSYTRSIYTPSTPYEFWADSSVHLSLEQHEFELRVSTYTLVVFYIVL